ncbi:MAG: tryptophan synthase subunit beta [Capnocytophaga sp.]|nr:tryptophan synthase subunit beta [Capnocytophaga sp.]
MEKFSVDANGYYGDFGGAFIPDELKPNLQELEENYKKIIHSDDFQKQYQQLLKDFVGRETPLFYAENLSKKYHTQIFLKREDLNHTGAHKLNNALGQALLAKKLGKKRVIAETGAGQHGVATATACALLGLECVIYMGELDTQRQALNVARMKMLGAKVVPATSGGKTLTDAVNEAFQNWVAHPADTYFLIGSAVGPHPYPDIVSHFQSVISKEIKKQLEEKIGKPNPDYVVACVGGGSNAVGAFYHFLDNENVKLIAIEGGGLGVNSGKTAATTALGTVGILHGSKSLVMQTEDKQLIEPYSISPGLDYPGIGPLFAHLFSVGRVEFLNATDDEAIQAALELSKEEGIIPALESSHALSILHKKDFSENEVVVINVSGRGDKDMETYLKYIN